MTNLSIFSFSNFLGFFGQHEQINEGVIRVGGGLSKFDNGLDFVSWMTGVSGGFRDEMTMSELYVATRKGMSDVVKSDGVRKLARSKVDALVKLEVADRRYEDALECG